MLRLPLPSPAAGNLLSAVIPAKEQPAPCSTRGHPVLRYVAGIQKSAGIAIAVLLCIATIACASPAAEPAPTAVPVVVVPTVDYSNDAIKPYLATKVLEVGTQRVAFLLSTNKALVKAPQSQITVTGQQGSEPVAEITADYNEWPYGVRGSYSAPIEFPEAGDYLLTVTPIGGDVEGEAHIPVKVLADVPVPSVGDTPPASQTKTLGDGLDLPDVTTAYQPDAGLYEVSVAYAVASGKPSVIVFATPAFCTSPTCGPQVDTVAELRAAHPGAANYIHVELYDNPAEIQGDLSQAQLVPAADEWGLTSIPEWTNESWVFVLDADGIVRQRFEGFATLAELEMALMEVAGS